MLTKEKVIEILQKSAAESQAATRVWLFGSYSRNEQNEKSDVDVLIETLSGPRIMSRLHKLLSPIEDLGIKTDLVTVASLNKMLKSEHDLTRQIGEEIDRTKELIYESK